MKRRTRGGSELGEPCALQPVLWDSVPPRGTGEEPPSNPLDHRGPDLLSGIQGWAVLRGRSSQNRRQRGTGRQLPGLSLWGDDRDK